MKETDIIPSGSERPPRAVLVAVAPEASEQCETSLSELARLLETAGGEEAARTVQYRRTPDAATYIGSGKLRELADFIAADGDITLAVFDNELSPSQISNISEVLGENVRVIDRTMLILDIFALHAVTGEGKLQVEIACLRYTAPRLTGRGKDMSRLGRDYLQVGMYTEIFFPEHDVHFIAVNDGVDSNQEDNEFTPFRNIINEWYAKDTSKKIRAVKRSKGMAGEHIGSHPPYGYRKNPENKKEWIVDEEAAEVVREIFRLCVSGYGPTQIANMLTEREILCPTYYALERGEKPRTVLPPHKYAWNGPVVAMILDRVDYLGHTVNFKTHNKSYKCHKKIKHTPDQWKVFEDTHEAIIDKETFEIVQKIRAGKRRPTRMGEMPMFSGLLYCADCGSKLTFHRKADEPAEKHHYICGNYRSNTSNCTMHYIRNVVVERIVLENLKEVIRYVSNYEDEFVRMVMDADVRQKNRELAQKKKKLIELQKRIGELDTIFQRIYEDNITGKLSDERFMKMSKGYEDEQHTLQAEADKIQNELQQEEKKSVDVKRFLAIVKKYTDLTELTPEILREFVDKIIVHAPDKSSGRRLQEIEIIYNHIGEFDHSKVTLWKGNAV